MTEQHGSTPRHRPALSVDEFCAKYRICRASFYNEIKRGRGPRVLKIGTRTLITAEADDEWRREREAVSVDA